jgi:hypothetical protein
MTGGFDVVGKPGGWLCLAWWSDTRSTELHIPPPNHSKPMHLTEFDGQDNAVTTTAPSAQQILDAVNRAWFGKEHGDE